MEKVPKDLVSIVMPFKNTANYLPECIASICNQTYTQWELIAVDDHSIDNSLNVLKKYAQLDNRIKCFPNKGNGVIDALQTARSFAQGHYITRFDSDDIMPNARLASQKKLLDAHGEGYIATAKVQYFSDHQVGKGYRAYENWINNLVDLNNHWDEIFKECVIPSPCWMMFTSDFDDIGGFESLEYPEDYDLVFRVWSKGMQVITNKDILLYWREHQGRTSRNDVRYTDTYFSKMKVTYFLKYRWIKNKPLCLWGAGNKGKDICNYLKQHHIPTIWLTANPKKQGKTIDGIRLQSIDNIDFISYQHIITFTDNKSKENVAQLFSDKNMSLNVDYFFFG